MLIKAFSDDTMSRMVFMFHVIKLWLRVLNVQVLHHEVRLVKMWKICTESDMRSAYI